MGGAARALVLVLGACGGVGEPSPSLWTPRFDGYFNYPGGFWPETAAGYQAVPGG
ncbi:hypothetical protein [Streptomyces sp. NBC_01353]|uniref:hypothetical protein n=1 Tax=Streptomyces sp. NBC_01353 TaxID=2903835 RepID=UPI002E34B859|nr:hypothetical protein [Streptomyces sp. NBC_01353]